MNKLNDIESLIKRSKKIYYEIATKRDELRDTIMELEGFLDDLHMACEDMQSGIDLLKCATETLSNNL